MFSHELSNGLDRIDTIALVPDLSVFRLDGGKANFFARRPAKRRIPLVVVEIGIDDKLDILGELARICLDRRLQHLPHGVIYGGAGKVIDGVISLARSDWRSTV